MQSFLLVGARYFFGGGKQISLFGGGGGKLVLLENFCQALKMFLGWMSE